jgi:GntR family transcriptional regulator
MANRYEAIADDMRRLIAVGTWPVGKRLPAESELASRYRVSTPTLRSSLEVLQSEGLVEKRHGIGNFVRRPEQRITYASNWPEAERRAATDTDAVSISLDTAVVEADSRLSLLLNVRVGSPLAEYIFLGRQGTSLQSLARIYVPHAVARLGVPDAADSPWGDGVRALLSAAGVQVAMTTERIIARFPMADETHLGITPRAPVLAVERVSTDANERVVEAALLVLPGDRTEILFSARSAAEAMETTG